MIKKPVVYDLVKLLWIALVVMQIPACGSLGYHEVRKGETLYSISWRYGEDYKKIAQWNGIESPYIIHEGDRLRLTPGPSTGKKPVNATSKQAVSRPARSRPEAEIRTPQNSSPPVTAKPAQQLQVKKPSLTIPNRKLTWTWPANGKIVKQYSKKGSGKKGIDISGKAGNPVRAAAYGRVVYSGSGLQRYGKLIIIKHNARYLSAYAHNRKLLVNEGAVVEKGQKIAEMGRTGTGVGHVMLHFEIRADGIPVDPLSFLPVRKK